MADTDDDEQPIEGDRMRDPGRLTGLLLIAGGVLWAVIAVTDLGGTVVVPGVGVAFLFAYLVTRRYGLLIPGGILSGLGMGLVVAAQGGPGEAVVLGLGLGFVAITVVDGLLGEGDAAWWPLIPGGILVVVGGSQIAGIRDIGRYLVPAALIVVGLSLLLRPSRDRRETTADRADPGRARGTPSDDSHEQPGGSDREKRRP